MLNNENQFADLMLVDTRMQEVWCIFGVWKVKIREIQIAYYGVEDASSELVKNGY